MMAHNRMNKYVEHVAYLHLHHRRRHHHLHLHRFGHHQPAEKKKKGKILILNENKMLFIQLGERFVEIQDALDVINHLYLYQAHWRNDIHVHGHVHFVSLSNKQKTHLNSPFEIVLLTVLSLLKSTGS